MIVTSNHPKPRLAVLASGYGSNFQSVIDHIHNGTLHAEIGVLISDQPNAFALDRARKAKIPVAVVQKGKQEPKEAFDLRIHQQILHYNATWVILAGYMRILGKRLIQLYPRKILNIHPSLLPKFPGLRAIEQALESNEKVTGATVHYVDEGVDTGPIILQERVEIRETDTVDSLKHRIQQIEHQIYPKAIQKVLWANKA